MERTSLLILRSNGQISVLTSSNSCPRHLKPSKPGGLYSPTLSHIFRQGSSKRLYICKHFGDVNIVGVG